MNTEMHTLTEARAWELYDRVAEDLARKGLEGEIGDPLPDCLNVEVYDLINADPEAFKDRVRLTAYALASKNMPDYSYEAIS